jgi:hypothetical protein
LPGNYTIVVENSLVLPLPAKVLLAGLSLLLIMLKARLRIAGDTMFYVKK